MRRKERKLKGTFGASFSEVEFGRQRGMWLKRNFVKSGSISLKVSFPLREVIGNEEVYCEREIVRKVWRYVNEKNLMDSSSIICDLKLRKIFGKKCQKLSKNKVAVVIKKYIERK